VLKYLQVKKAFLAFLLSLFVLVAIAPHKVNAASATINTNPQSGVFDKPFIVNFVIDGHGERFNAAQATVSISSGFAIQDLVLGDCNLSFLKTPSIQNPSFAGIIISTFTTKCTVYTLILVPIAKGNATVTLSHGSVKRFGDAAEILAKTINGSYTLTEALKMPSGSEDQTKQSSEGLYTVDLKFSSQDEKKAGNASVSLNSVSKKNHVEKITNAQGNVQFFNVQSGIYSVTVTKDNKKIGETILNVNGASHVLTLGINLDAQKKNNPLLKNQNTLFNVFSSSPFLIGGILILGIGIGTAFSFFIHKSKSKNNTLSQ